MLLVEFYAEYGYIVLWSQYYKTGQLFNNKSGQKLITNRNSFFIAYWTRFITNRGKFMINRGKHYILGQLLQISA